MKKYAETVDLYDNIHKRLSIVLGGINKVEFKKDDKFVYVPCSSRYLLYTTRVNKYSYWYFYSLDSRDKDFSIESDSDLGRNSECLFECTIFGKQVLIYDILYRNAPIKSDFGLRYNLLLELLGTDSFKSGEYKFRVSTVLSKDCNLSIFRRNYKYSNLYFLKVYNSYSKQLVQDSRTYLESELKIESTNKSEVFSVYSKDTNEYFGLLYIKTLADSKYVNGLFKTQSIVSHKCKYNEKYHKWQICV